MDNNKNFLVILIAIIVISCKSELHSNIDTIPSAEYSVYSQTQTEIPPLISEIFPSPTLYSKQELPSFSGEIFPISSRVIGIENIQQIRELSVWGSGWVTDIATSPDGSILAAASSIGVILYNSETFIPFQFLHYDAESLAFSPDGKILAIGLKNSQIQLWNISKEESMGQLFGFTGEVSSLAFSSDGKSLASGSGNRTIKLWDVENQIEKFTLDGLGKYVMSVVSTVLFSPDDKYLYSSDWDGNIRKWDLNSREMVFSITTEAYISMGLSSDGTILASSGFENNTINLWDSGNGIKIGELAGHNNIIRRIEFSPKGKNLASCSYDGTVRIWDIETKRQILLLRDNPTSCTSIGYLPNGIQIISTSDTGVWSDDPINTITKWDTSSGKVINTKTSKSLMRINSITISPDGKMLASGSGSATVKSSWGDIKLWDMTNGTIIRTIKGNGELIHEVTFSPNGNILASVDYDGVICLWDVETGNKINSFLEKDTHNIRVIKIAFSVDGKELFSLTSGLLTIWDISNGILKKQIVIPSEMDQFTFSNDKRLMAMGSSFNNSVIVLDINSGQENEIFIGENSEVSSLALLPDNKKLAIGMNYSGIEIVNIASGVIYQSFTDQQLGIKKIVFSSDGNIMVSSSADGRIIFWNALTGQNLLSLIGHTSAVNDILISPNDRLIISGSQDETIRIWGLYS